MKKRFERFEIKGKDQKWLVRYGPSFASGNLMNISLKERKFLECVMTSSGEVTIGINDLRWKASCSLV